jgi:hypothetical protein
MAKRYANHPPQHPPVEQESYDSTHRREVSISFNVSRDSGIEAEGRGSSICSRPTRGTA